MRKVTCQDCGRQYDYDKDDFCPKCGSYNPPGSAASTKLERDLLIRFHDGREGQKRTAPARPPGTAGQKTPVRTPSGGPPARKPTAVQERFPQAQYTPHSVGAALEGRGTHRESIGSCDIKPPKAKPGLLILVVVVLVVLVNLLPTLMEAIPKLLPQIGMEETAASAAGEPQITRHSVGDTFALNDVEVSVSDLWWLDLSSLPAYEREGLRALAVSLYITGGERRDDLYIPDPVLECGSGMLLPLEHDVEFSHALKKTANLYAVTLSDYQWEDPFYGQLLFYVPDGETVPELVLDEYAPGNLEDPVLVNTHRIPLVLP